MKTQLSAGAALERAIRADLPEHVEFDPREEAAHAKQPADAAEGGGEGDAGSRVSGVNLHALMLRPC